MEASFGLNAIYVSFTPSAARPAIPVAPAGCATGRSILSASTVFIALAAAIFARWPPNIRAGRGVVERRMARCRSGRYGSYRTSHCGQRRLIIERDLTEGFHPQVIPKSRQIALDRLRSHLLVEFGQYRSSCGFVADH